ncbi:MAG: hypothetical protein HKN08_09380, partial [Gammaproteobacteria bacterium]|nr:hypothetical protein [Gammaproteobacteria bacterium]
MLTGLFLLISLIVIAVLINLLHKNQVRKSREIADQSSPLPSLKPAKSVNADSASPVLVVAALDSSINTKASWQEEVRQLRESGKYQEAINLCRRQYPKMLALKQTLVTLRAKIKKEDNQSDESLQA